VGRQTCTDISHGACSGRCRAMQTAQRSMTDGRADAESLPFAYAVEVSDLCATSTRWSTTSPTERAASGLSFTRAAARGKARVRRRASPPRRTALGTVPKRTAIRGSSPTCARCSAPHRQRPRWHNGGSTTTRPSVEPFVDIMRSRPETGAGTRIRRFADVYGARRGLVANCVRLVQRRWRRGAPATSAMLWSAAFNGLPVAASADTPCRRRLPPAISTTVLRRAQEGGGLRGPRARHGHKTCPREEPDRSSASFRCSSWGSCALPRAGDPASHIFRGRTHTRL